MSLRTRVAIAFAAAAALAAVLMGLVSYQAVAQNVHVEVDRSLATTAAQLTAGGLRTPLPQANGPDPDGDEGHRGPNTTVIAQVISPDGTVRALAGSAGQLPIDDTDRALAAAPGSGSGSARRREQTLSVRGVDYRVLTQQLGPRQGALQVARSLDESERVLSGVAALIAAAGAVVLLGAAAVGWFVAHRITRRLVRLTELAEQVSATERLEVEVPTGGRDEVGRLGGALDTMLGRLARSRDDQQRLVQDAGHELRTPLTSLRTNVTVLRQFDELEPEARSRLLADVDGETRELTDLVNELIELATRQYDGELAEDVGLAGVVERAAARVRRRSGREITVDADDTVVTGGRRQGLERAVSNLLENAVKFDRTDQAPIELAVAAGRVEVRDRGPGIDPQDVEHIFDRFYRATSARSLPGSGLGLAIVREIAYSHGGEVFAQTRPGGGAVVGFTVTFSRNSKPGHVEP